MALICENELLSCLVLFISKTVLKMISKHKFLSYGVTAPFYYFYLPGLSLFSNEKSVIESMEQNVACFRIQRL